MAKNKKCDGFLSNFFLACIEKIVKSILCVWRYVLSAVGQGHSERGTIFPQRSFPAPFMERGLGERSTLGYSIEIARNLLSMRMAKPEVAEATGLSIEEVDRLALSYV